MKPSVAILLLTFPGCACYREHSVVYNTDGSVRQEINVTYRTGLMGSQASKFSSETQTEDFIRTVNSDNPRVNVDADSVKAITEGVTSAVIKAIVPVP